MFTSFFENADLLALIVLCYALSVGFLVIEANRDQYRVRWSEATIVRSWYGTLFAYAITPGPFIGGFYIGSYSGFWGGVIGLVGLYIFSGVVAIFFGVKKNLGIHLMIAPIPLIYAYTKIATTWG